MSYEILVMEEGLSIVHITVAECNSLKGWLFEFPNGKEATVYKNKEQWTQFNDNWLDELTLLALGKCIDNKLKERSSASDHFFYEMFIE